MHLFYRYAGLFMLFVVPLVHAADTADISITIVPSISDNYILDDYRPPAAGQAAQISLVAAPNEYEPASFVLLANEKINDLQLAASPLVNSAGVKLAGARLDIRIVKRWYQRSFGVQADASDPRLRTLTPELLVYDDALVKTEGDENYLRLPSGEYIHISKAGKKRGFGTPTLAELPVRDADQLLPLSLAKNENRQIWVTLYVPPDAEAGLYSAAIDLRVGEGLLRKIPVLVEVLPFQLDEPQIDYSIYYRGQLDKAWPDGSVSSEYKSEAQLLSDLQNLAAHGIRNPTVYQVYQTNKLETILRLREQAGMNNPRLYYLGMNEAAGNDGNVSPRLAGQVKDVVKTASRYGIDEVYFYARDEAQKELLITQFSYWNVIKKAGGKVMAAGLQTDGTHVGNFDITGGKEDLFVSLGAVRLQEARRWHSKDRLIFSYQNPTGGWEIPETWRRNYGLLLWQNEYDGALPYAWQHSYSDAWNDFDSFEYKDHNFTYPTVDGQIDTLHWEGLREGVDDMRYLSTLINSLADAEGDDSPAATEAQAWLAELKTRSLGQSDLGLLRAEMIGHILALRGIVSNARGKPIEDVHVLPIETGGVTAVTWTTPDRTPGFLQIEKDNAVINVAASGLRRYHELSVAGLQPNQAYPFSAHSYLDAEGNPVLNTGLIDTASAITMTSNALETDTAVILDVGVTSNYRASVGVDWRRSLMGWWRFSSAESPGIDSSSWDSDAKLKRGAKLGDGWFGKGVALNGSGDFVYMPDIEIPENGTATVEGWFRFHSFAMDNLVNMGLFSGFYQHASNNNFYFYSTNENFEVGSLLQLNTWHHIALTWSGDTASAAIYVDGQRARVTVQGDVEEVLSINGLSIGRSAGYLGGLVGAATDTFDGDIDEIRVWNRVLSADEIQASYNAHQARLEFTFPLEAKKSAEFSLIGANAADRIALE